MKIVHEFVGQRSEQRCPPRLLNAFESLKKKVASAPSTKEWNSLIATPPKSTSFSETIRYDLRYVTNLKSRSLSVKTVFAVSCLDENNSSGFAEMVTGAVYNPISTLRSLWEMYFFFFDGYLMSTSPWPMCKRKIEFVRSLKSLW
jgi:hypothetical protein